MADNTTLPEGPALYKRAEFTPTQATDAVWVLTSAGFIFLIQAGVMLIEAGAVSRKNRNSALIKNLFTTAIVATSWWMWGYALAFGTPEYFVGNNGNFYGAVGFEDMPRDHYL